MKRLRDLMRSAVDRGVFPGGVLLTARNSQILYSEAFGLARLSPKRPMTTDTVFDLASLTKPLATAVSLMVLAGQGAIGLNQTLGTIVSEFSDTDKGQITIRQLASHVSGLPDYRPYFNKLKDLTPSQAKSGMERLLVAEPLINRPGEVCLYSDLGFMILQWVIDMVTGTCLDEFVERSVYRPLGLKYLFFNHLDKAEAKRHCSYAATEACPWRDKILDGEVHDDNAYVLGGVAGHAGLFGTAQDIFRLLQHLLDVDSGKKVSRVFDRKTVQTFFRRQSDVGSWALGFDTPSRPESSSGKYFSDHSVGHLGFTGTSFWMDLERAVIVILLTNRVHPTRTNEKLKPFRPIIHNAVIEACNSV